MVSQAWKGLERSVAKYFGGTRLIKPHYGVSQPDVYVDSYPLGKNQVSLLIECKYSQNQVWHKLITSVLCKDKYMSIVKTDNYIFWDMKNSDLIMPALTLEGLAYLFHINTIQKKEPVYLNDIFLQSLSYYNQFKKPDKELKTLICLGQKGSKIKLIGGDVEQLVT